MMVPAYDVLVDLVFIERIVLDAESARRDLFAREQRRRIVLLLTTIAARSENAAPLLGSSPVEPSSGLNGVAPSRFASGP